MRIVVTAVLLTCSASVAWPHTQNLAGLTVEYRHTPLGIDVPQPHFGWQMTASDHSRGVSQSAYQIVVKDPQGATVWDSHRVNNGRSLDIPYGGVALEASTRYSWQLTVWDESQNRTSSRSWFETGLMSPDSGLKAWDGATWIGGGDEDLVLYSHYLPLFDLKYDLTLPAGSSRAAIVLAANDSRMMDRNKNSFGLQESRNQSYMKVELDTSGLTDASGAAHLNFYRAGYSDHDDASKPVASFAIKTEFLNAANRNQTHHFLIHAEYGELWVTMDGSSTFLVPTAAEPPPSAYSGQNRGISVALNPLGRAHDVITFGMLCDLGFSVDAGQSAEFSGLEVANTRKPANALFHEDLGGPSYDGIFKTQAADAASGLRVEHGAYLLTGGTRGTLVTADPSHGAMPMLRTQFSLNGKSVRSARLYVTARGIYEIYLNGRRVGNDHYNPGLTQYNITHLYQTYDVTSMLVAGRNAMGAMLGEGWWSGLLSFGNVWNHFGDRQSLLAKLVITFSDGSHTIVTSNDRDWKYYGHGPVIYSSLDMGEAYDATRDAAIAGWSTASYDDHDWKRAVTVPLQGTSYTGVSTGFGGAVSTIDYDHLSLIGQIGNSAAVFKTLTAQSVTQVRPGVYVYNMGQNIVGVPKIAISNGIAGRRLTIRVSEMLYPNLKASGQSAGMIMTENYRAALSQDTYIMKAGAQVVQPHFTSHGYQYLELTGIDAPLPLSAVQGLAMSSIRTLTASYDSSNAKVNKLWSNLTWSNIDNFLTIPTDCPQRNERMGWSGDISIFSRTATYLSNADQFLTRHMYAMRDVQTAQGKFTDIAPVGGGFGGILWGSAGITIPWEVYQQYNDSGLLRQHYDAMAAYMSYLQNNIDPKTGLITDAQLGDWLGPQNNQLGADFLATAYHIFDLDIMARIATAIGKADDAAKYQQLRDERKAFFNRTFVNADHETVGLIGAGGFGPPSATPAAPAEFKLADTQTSYAVGLALGAFSDENIPYMAANLKRAVERSNSDDQGVVRPPYSLMTGFIGTAWISKALSDRGMTDDAYRVLQNSQYPSWLYAIDQGATTIWERLNGYTVEDGFGGNNSMNSFNHYSFGAVGQWLMAYSLGIQRDEPGFKKFILQPEPDPSGQMTWARGHYDSAYGRIDSQWSISAGRLSYSATVPANTTATLYLPTRDPRTVTESGRAATNAVGVQFVRFDHDRAVYTLSSGRYNFVALQ